MSPATTRRWSGRALQWLVCLLCATVFAWGFQAKLSLYKRPTPSHPVSVAKLCQDDQAGKHTCEVAAQNHGPLTPDLTCGVQIPFRPRLTVRRDRQVSTLVHPAIPSYPHALFFRPPPLSS